MHGKNKDSSLVRRNELSANYSRFKTAESDIVNDKGHFFKQRRAEISRVDASLKKQSTSCGMEKKNNDEHDFEERRKYTRTREVRVVPRSAVIKTIIRMLFKIEKRKIRC